jgi:1-acyl-sn-glycerol-3-phosphate acyltransferase
MLGYCFNSAYNTLLCWANGLKFEGYKQMLGKKWVRSLWWWSVFRIRIRIRIRNADPDMMQSYFRQIIWSKNVECDKN